MFIVPLTPMATQLDSVSDSLKKNSGSTADTIEDEVMSFADYLKESVMKVKELEASSDKSAYDLAVGNTNDIEAVMIESAKASTAVETTVQITTRAVNAYKEILQMQI